MIESLTSFFQDNQAILGMMAGFSIVMFVGSILSLPWLLSLIPTDYFVSAEPYRVEHPPAHPVIRIIIISLKNLLGWILIIAGIAMLVLPGQGLLTIVMGLLLINFPGKRRFERSLVRSPRVLRSINWFRCRRGKPSLLAPE